jgi:hypothetical protein
MILAADHIDFGKPPKSPMEEIKSLIEKAIGTAASHSNLKKNREG